jgi:hypothetical protein
MSVTAHINVCTPKGRKIVRELESNKKLVKIENPMPLGEDGVPAKTHSLDESFENLWDKMEEHYGLDLRKL